MLSLEEAQAAIIDGMAVATETETVDLAQAHRRYLAGEVAARVDNPAFDNSAMDGYAVNSAQLLAAGFRLPLVGESSAGDAPGRLSPDTTMRIFTGAPLPVGADAVVIQEDIKIEDATIVFPHTVQPGQNIRTLGQDFRHGDLLYGPGRRVSAFDVAFQSPADAIILISDGLPNPAFNNGLSPGRLVRAITVSNSRGQEVHAVTVGDYFKYRGTIEFMESLARANSGAFLALAE